ncbi:phytanoyl-CoA dioxygenase family protein [Sphingomonas lenta]|uniref:Phytanoyl-CoA dioxygenase n=1 Tax=Sphingomonas lenta TaxID=1141887 RepID=A0A2A2SIG6_9SPHN|nr:phytanoyl-CoA dioxygenase family protein [Sphingomonas lenta]PAX09074.1 phytanoyl-CoA dioxygenase [Sphingomonas lenta]
MTHDDLDRPYPLTTEQVESYRANGFVRLKDVLSPDTLAHYRDVISAEVTALAPPLPPMAERSTYDRAFLQVENLWRHSDTVKRFVFGKRMARIAAELMGVDGVRLYHDQALYKEPGGGHTPWHADQFYWPLSNDNTVTAWIPLQPVTPDMGPMSFAAGSHVVDDIGRDVGISDQSEALIGETLRERGFRIDTAPYELGDVSFHSGWVFHAAGANATDRPRRAMTMIYMDAEMRLAEPLNQNQRNDWANWCAGAKVGGVIDTPTNPVLFQAPRA